MVSLLAPLQQHGATLAAADAERCHAALRSGALQGLKQVQDDPGAAGSHRMTEGNGAAVHVEALRIDCGKGLPEPQLLPGVVVAAPGSLAGQHLGAKSFV